MVVAAQGCGPPDVDLKLDDKSGWGVITVTGVKIRLILFLHNKQKLDSVFPLVFKTV